MVVFFSAAAASGFKNVEVLFTQGAFNDYVDTILPFFDHHLPLRAYLTLNMDKNRDFWTTYHLFLST